MSDGFLVDTNVWSEGIAERPAPAVVAWMSDHATTVRMSVTTVMELAYGVARLPLGRRRRALEEKIAAILGPLGDVILDYNVAVARAHAALRVEQAAHGVTASSEDGQIAAIAKVHALTVARRNVRHFAHAGVAVVDPWAYLNPQGAVRPGS